MSQAKCYMLDTNMVSHIIRGHEHAIRRLMATPIEKICLSTITEAELAFGLAKRPNAKNLQHAIHEFILRVEVMPWDRQAAVTYGAVRAKMMQHGKTLSHLDFLIAAHALSRKYCLVTNDQAFKHVMGLETEDWCSP